MRLHSTRWQDRQQHAAESGSSRSSGLAPLGRRRASSLRCGPRRNYAHAPCIICCGNGGAYALRGNAVPAKSQRLALLVVLVMGLLMVSPLAGEV
jgi:hypothetical protein